MLQESLFESDELLAQRQEVMGLLHTIVKGWVRTVAEHLNLGEHLISEANAKVYTFGSYRLGVHLPGACQALALVAALCRIVGKTNGNGN